MAGIIMVLLFSAGAASVLAAQTATTVTSLKIPFSRIGDAGTYDREFVQQGAEIREGQWHFSVDGPNRIRDQFGRERDALILARVVPVDDNSTGIGSGFHQTGVRTTKVLFDPAFRITLTLEEDFKRTEEEWAQDYYRKWNRTTSTTFFAPSGPRGSTIDSWLALQGTNLTAGMPAQRIAEQLVSTFHQVPGQPWKFGLPSASVVKPEDPNDANLGVTLSVCAEPLFRKAYANDRFAFFGHYLSVVVPTCIESTFWYQAGLPYPFRIEQRLQLQGLHAIEVRDELVAFTPGHGSPGPPHVDLAPPMPRNVVGSFPPEGAAGLDYPLSEAVSAVQTDPTLVAYQTWRARNPNHQLAGITYYPVDQGGWQWELMWRADSGSYHKVRTQRTAAGGTQTFEHANTLADARGPPAPSPAVVTIADAARFFDEWRANTAASESINFIEWGMLHSTLCADVACPGGGPGGIALAAPLGPNLLVVGNTPVRYVGGPTGTLVVPHDHHNQLLVDASTGARIMAVNQTFSQPSRVPTLEAATGAWKPAVSQPQKAGIVAAPSLDTTAAVALPLLAVFLAVYFYPAIKVLASNLWGALGGYAKLRKEAILGHPIREDLAALIRAEPGITPVQAAKTLGQPLTTLVYHLRVLETNHLVAIQRDGRHRRLFASEVAPKDRAPNAALKNPRTRRLFDLIRERPNATQAELAAQLGIRQPSLLWHVRRLAAAGLIQQARRGRYVHYQAAESSRAGSL